VSRYSHHGPVAQPKGGAVSSATLKTLYDANKFLSWTSIARHCRVSRATMYRVMCGGNTHTLTVESVERFAEMWRNADDATIASLMARWSEKRKAAA
jgi:hypothetical protein